MNTPSHDPSEEPKAVPPPSDESAAAQGAVAPDAAPPETPKSVDEDAAKSPGVAGLRIQIGSLGDRQMAREAKPMPTVAPPGPEVKTDDGPREPHEEPSPSPEPTFPPTNLRSQLPPDLEEEVEAALGGLSLDEMLAGGATAAVADDLQPDTRTTGRVVSIHRDDVFVDLGGQRQGVVSLKQFAEPPQPGDSLELLVTRLNAEEGLYELGVPGATVAVGNWSDVAEGLVVQATITGHNKGGLECQVSGLRGFIPVSQIALYRVEDLGPFVGQSFACVVNEADPERRNLVLSRRAMLEREQAEAKQKLLEELAPGQRREGVVRSLQNFGAFVDLGGADGLIPIGHLSWDRIKHPSEVVEVGQKVRVTIEKFDRATGKIGLSYRDEAENPWRSVVAKYPVGTPVRGTVSKIMDFGAFVKLEPGVEGLIHISELSHKRVWRASDVVSEGQTVEVLVQSVDADAQRIGLSLKALEARPQKAEQKQKEPEPEIAEAPRASKKRKTPLKGGLGGGSGGDQFGLNW